MRITVFTPAYNRRHTLPRLYESLCRQEFCDFEWLIVDDGSTDGTEEIISEFENRAAFPIRYHKKENGGKHTAYNYAVDRAAGAYFFCVDSDDYLAPDALCALAGAVTGIIHVKCRVRDLLSGIIVMTGLYSLNLRVAQDKANLPIFGTDTLFKNGLTAALPDAVADYAPVLILLALVVLCKLCMDWFLRTRAGYLLRAVGDNPTVVTALAKDGGMVKIQGLAIANALVALSGCVMCQYQRFFEISMGTGAIVIGLASVIIGTNLFKNLSFLRATSAVVIGSILYKACVAIALSSGLLPKPQDMKFVTAVLFLLILALGEVRRKKVKAHA